MGRPILLVNPPYSSWQQLTRSDLADHQEPLGILFIAGYLRAKGVDVQAVDCVTDSVRKIGDYYWQGAGEEEIEAELRNRCPQVVGISSMFSVHCHAVHRVAAVVKRAIPDALVVVGGTHASAFPEVVLDDKNIDLVVIGEGEETLYEIIERHTRREPLQGIAGTAHIDRSGVYHVSESREFLDLRAHPGPARDLLDIKRYVATEYSRRHAMHSRRLPVVTSRGCPYDCVFCSIHSVWRRSYHTRNPATVLREIQWLVNEHGVHEIMFWDDNLAANRRHFEEILDGIIEHRIPIRWCTPNGIAIWLLDEEILKKCRRSGCYKLTFGIETGSKKTQEFIGKTHIDLDRTKELIEFSNGLGIWTQAMFMIGFPFETREDILETIEYSVDCGVDAANYKIAVPYPGSRMYRVYRENGLLPGDVESRSPDCWIGNITRATLSTACLSSDELQSLFDLARKRFNQHQRRRLRNPFYVARKINGWDDLRYVGKLARLMVPWPASSKKRAEC